MKKRYVLILILCIVALLGGLGAKYYTDHYIWIAGESVSRDLTEVDLRGAELSLEDVQKLREEMPDCEIKWDVPFQGERYPYNTQKLEVTSLTEEDLAVLEYFPNLIRLEAEHCTDYAQLLSFFKSRPDCSVNYVVPLGGAEYDSHTESLEIADPDYQEISEKLPYLPEVTQLHLTGQLPELTQLETLMQSFPEMDIQWDIVLDGRTVSSTVTELNLSGKERRHQDVEEVLSWLPNLEKVDMRGCGLTDREMMQLADTYSDSFFLWDMTIGELQIPTDSEEVDISGQVLQSTKEIEDLLPYFPNVKKVVMSHCGFDDETMDALDKRYDDIRFVWSIQVQHVSIRTDSTFFYPFKYDKNMKVDNDDLYPLRYCPDMIAIDIGHMWGVTDCEWAAFMPNLKYLILVETQILDLTPLSNLKNLVFLEIFKTNIRDYSPLVGCTALEDINMCHTYGDYRPIAQMTWLKNIWWNGIAGTRGMPCSGAELVLPEALPNTKLVFNQANSAWYTGWRDLDNYKAMRDVMGMFYLR